MRLIHLSDIHFGGYGAGWDPDEDQRNELLLDIDRLVAAGGPVDGVLVGVTLRFRRLRTSTSGRPHGLPKWRVEAAAKAPKCGSFLAIMT